jgi:hypothetical protein
MLLVIASALLVLESLELRHAWTTASHGAMDDA